MTEIKQQHQILQNLAKQLWQAYSMGHVSLVKETFNSKDFRKDMKEELEFFFNMEYSKYRLEKEIEFPHFVKPGYFLHLMNWSSDFKKRHENINQLLIEVPTEIIVLEKIKLLTLFNKNLNQATVDKFEESFQSENELKEKFQTLVFKLAKKDLGFNEDLVEISNIYYFNSMRPENPGKLMKTVINKQLEMELKVKTEKESKKIKI